MEPLKITHRIMDASVDVSVSSLDGAGDAVPTATGKKQQREKKGAFFDKATHTPVIFALQSPMLQEKVPVGLIRLPIVRDKAAEALETTLALMRSDAGGAISPGAGDAAAGGYGGLPEGSLGPPQPGMLREVVLDRTDVACGLGMVLKFRKAESGGVRSFVSEVADMSLAARTRGTLVGVDEEVGEDGVGKANHLCAGLTPGDEIVSINRQNLMLKSAAEVLQSMDTDVVSIRCVFPLEAEPGIGAGGSGSKKTGGAAGGKAGGDTSDECTVS